MQKKFDADFAAFVKGSKTPEGYRAYGLIVRYGGKNEIFYSCSYVCDGHIETEYETTSARMEYEAIVKATSIISPGKSVIIYTNNETAVKVFAGEWKAKQHRDLLKLFKKWSSTRDIKVQHALSPNEDWEEYIDDGMTAADNFCRMAIRDVREGRYKRLPAIRF